MTEVSPNADYERIEFALRSVLDDDEASDLTLMLKEESESVMWILYEQWPTRHAPNDGLGTS